MWIVFFLLILLVLKHRFLWAPRKMFLNKKSSPVFFSHRGITKKFPENTIEAFIDAIKNGYDAVEMDLVRTGDNELVCSHNYDLEIETDGEGSFKNKSLKDLKKIKTGVYTDHKNTKSIPNFKELMSAIPNNIFLNIELKTEAWYDLKSVRILDRYRKEGWLKRNYLVSSFNPLLVFYIRYFTKLDRVAFLVMYRDWLWLVNWIHPDALHPSAELLNEEIINFCKKKKIAINTWTVNNLSAIKHCLKLKVDGIITDIDKPLLFKDL